MNAAQQHLADNGSSAWDQGERATGLFNRLPEWSEYFARLSK
jgi:hypothetical protein